MKTKLEQLREVLNAAAESVEGARARVVQNADGSIDGEILVPVERGESVEAALENIEEALRKKGPGRVYYSTGFRWEPRPIDDKRSYDRHHGLFEQFSHYYGDLPESVALTETIIDGMSRRRMRKPIQAIVRVHWNRAGIRPGRKSR